MDGDCLRILGDSRPEVLDYRQHKALFKHSRELWQLR